MKTYKQYILKENSNHLYKEWFDAIKFNDGNEIDKLIAIGIDVDMIDQYGHTALLLCALKGHRASLQKILDAGANINFRRTGKDKWTALMCSYKYLSITEDLIFKGADMTLIDNVGHNFIDIGCNYNSLVFKAWLNQEYLQGWILTKEPTLIKSFIKNEITLHPNTLKKFGHLITADDLGMLENNNRKINSFRLFEESSLEKRLIASVNDDDCDLSLIKYYIEQGVDINYQDPYMFTALMYACRISNEPVIKLLLSQPNIDVTLTNIDRDNFIDILIDEDVLYDYTLQKKIMENNRPDIILFIHDRGWIHPEIKKEYPYLFTGLDLNLL